MLPTHGSSISHHHLFFACVWWTWYLRIFAPAWLACWARNWCSLLLLLLLLLYLLLFLRSCCCCIIMRATKRSDTSFTLIVHLSWLSFRQQSTDSVPVCGCCLRIPCFIACFKHRLLLQAKDQLRDPYGPNACMIWWSCVLCCVWRMRDDRMFLSSFCSSPPHYVMILNSTFLSTLLHSIFTPQKSFSSRIHTHSIRTHKWFRNICAQANETIVKVLTLPPVQSS